MTKGRLEAFSDGVLAIIITIMVLELKVPHEADLAALQPLLPAFIGYVLSFTYIGIYWNNHHHLLHIAKHVTGGILWANLHLLFWLSLIPFVSGWAGENHFAPLPMAFYGGVLFMAAIAYYILQTSILHQHGKDSAIAKTFGSDFKGKASPILYLVAVGSTCISEWIAFGIYWVVALMWLIPDKRIERAIAKER